LLKRWLIVVFTIGILLLLHVEQVSAYVHHEVEVDQETREALKKKYGLDAPSDPAPMNHLLSGDWGISFNPPLDRHQTILQIVRWVQQPITLIIRLIV